jgi:hypothetical protein
MGVASVAESGQLSAGRGAHRFWLVLICLWIVLASLGPDMRLGNSLLVVRPEDILTLLMGVLVFFKLLVGRSRRSTMSIFLRMASFLSGLVVIACIALLIYQPGERELLGTFGYDRNHEIFKESLRFFKYLLIAFSLSQVPYYTWKPVVGTLVVCCLLMVGVQVIQFIDSGWINPWLSDVYGNGTPHSSITYTEGWAKESQDFRSGSVMINANVFGLYLIPSFFLVVFLLLESIHSTLRVDKKFIFLWLGASCILCGGIFLCQSRTVLIAISVGIIAGIRYIPRKQRRGLGRVVAWVIFVAVSFNHFLESSTSRYSWKGLSAGIFHQSFNIKVRLTLESIERLGLDVVFGAGPAGEQMVDNELGYIITWYGLAGLLLYFLFYFSLHRLVIRRIHNIYICAAFVGIITSYIVSSLGNSVLLNNRIFPVFISLLTIACAEMQKVSTPLRERSSPKLFEKQNIRK